LVVVVRGPPEDGASAGRRVSGRGASVPWIGGDLRAASELRATEGPFDADDADTDDADTMTKEPH
jgi:hypothetical protein